MQRLINISGQEATDLGLNVSAEKSGVMVFIEPTTSTASIQHGELPRVKEYKYLGVWINEGDSYLRTHEEQLKGKGKRNAAIMKHRALWGYNKYEVVRGSVERSKDSGSHICECCTLLKIRRSITPSSEPENSRPFGLRRAWKNN